MDNREWINLFLCLLIALAFIRGWGKIRTKLANMRFSKGQKCIERQDYLAAIKILEDIGEDMKYSSAYWYAVAVAFVGTGARDDAKEALKKTLRLDSKHAQALELAKLLNATGYSATKPRC